MSGDMPREGDKRVTVIIDRVTVIIDIAPTCDETGPAGRGTP